MFCATETRMSDDEKTEQPTQRTASAPARKMRRISPAHSIADMGVMGAMQHLKSEGRQLRATGIAALLQGGAGAMQPHLATYLSGTAARTYEDESGTDFAMENTSVFNKLFADGVVMNSNTGTIAAAFNAELCFNLHLDLIDQLKTTSINAVDGAPGLLLKNADGAAVVKEKRGGFQDAYQNVNVRAMRFNKPDQDRCIYGYTASEFKKVLGSRGALLTTHVSEEVAKHFEKKAPYVHQVHVLFHWNDHSFFTYHKDAKGQVAVVVNLAPACTTDFHVAGAPEKAKMEWPGHAHIVPTNVYHRSGTAPRRCIKLVFFLDLIEKKDQVDVDEKASASGTAGAVEDNVKPEVKPEKSADE